MGKLFVVPNSELEEKYRKVLNIIQNNKDIDSLKDVKLNCLFTVFSTISEYINQGFPYNLVISILDKKTEFIINAISEEDAMEAIRLSTCCFLKKGVKVNKYHIPAEELILLNIAANLHPLNDRAKRRYKQLYNSCALQGQGVS